MTALDRYIDNLVKGIDTKDDFPKNESSWEELFDLCKRLISEIVALRRVAANSCPRGGLHEYVPMTLKDINWQTCKKCGNYR